MPPRLRALEAVPFEREGRAFVRLRDPLGVSPSASAAAGMALAAAHWELARRLDGATEVAAAAAAAGLDEREARAAIEHFGAALLLDDQRSRQALELALAELRASELLAPRGAGSDYESDPVSLRIAIAGLVADDWDMPPPADVAGAWAPASGLRRRAALFARCYAALRHLGPGFARVLFLAPVPAALESPLVPLDRPLATPLGALAFDREAVDLLPPARGHDLLAHSVSLALERHALFLRLLMGRVPVVGVLVPAAAQDTPGPPAALSAALQALRSVFELPGRTLLVTALDLAELPGHDRTSGPPPGGRSPLDRRGRASDEATGVIVTGGAQERLRVDDARYLDAATRLADGELWSLAVNGADALRRACAPTAWLALKLLQERRSAAGGVQVRGSLLGYMQSAERTGVVSGACVVFH